MNRRDFLKGAAVAAAGAGLPSAAKAEPAKMDAGQVAYSRRLPVRVETDVMVCGGGAAGVAAAVAARAAADGVFREPDLHMTGLYAFPDGYATANVGHVFGLDGTDERSLTKGYLRGRESMREYQRYFREYLKRGLENARLVETAALMGVRETRRICGDYVMTLEDYMKRAVFPDEIGRYAYPIDIHPSSADKAAYERHREEFDRLYKYGKGESYGIPYRILCAKGVKNLLVAGRCVSTDQKVQASIRVMPACYLTGQAAGFAAAMAADGAGDVHAVDVPRLQGALADFGAYLPNRA